MTNKDIHIAIEKRGLSFAFAVIMHVLLLIFLIFGMHWQNHSVTPLEAEIWGSIPTASERAPGAKNTLLKQLKTPAKVVKEKSVKSRAAQANPDIIEEKKQLQQNLHQEPVNKEKGAPKKQDIPPRTEKAPILKMAENKKVADNPLDLQNILKSAATKSPQEKSTINSAQGPAKEAAPTTASGGKGNALEGYVNQLKQLIRDKTVYADSGTGNPSAIIKIFVLPDGTIRNVQIVSKTGDPAFANARKQALLIMQRLPPLPADMYFSEQREWTIRTRLRE